MAATEPDQTDPTETPEDEPSPAPDAKTVPPQAMYVSGAAISIGGLLVALIQLFIGAVPQPWSTMLIATGIVIIIVQLVLSLVPVKGASPPRSPPASS